VLQQLRLLVEASHVVGGIDVMGGRFLRDTPRQAAANGRVEAQPDPAGQQPPRRCQGPVGGELLAHDVTLAAARTMASAMSSMATICSAAPLSCAARGMPNTALVA